MDTLMTKIMTFTQNLVDADRASLFLVDNTTNELYARIFDMGDDMASSEKVVNEIRFPIGTGIAGQVALTGKVNYQFNSSFVFFSNPHTQSIQVLKYSIYQLI